MVTKERLQQIMAKPYCRLSKKEKQQIHEYYEWWKDHHRPLNEHEIKYRNNLIKKTFEEIKNGSN